MTPAARIEAAAEILDDIIGSAPAEKVLTGWARRSRFAGSRDRAAVRDLVFDALRCRRSFGWLGGSDTGRGLMLGQVKAAGSDPDAVFTGERHAPAPLTEDERAAPGTLADAPAPVRLDLPDWLLPRLEDSLGSAAFEALDALRARAPVTLRANIARTSRDALIARLSSDGFGAEAHPLARGAVVVGGDTRGLVRHAAFEEGWFEFQDAASQAATEEIADLVRRASVLDFCAGGGGKALAVAALGADRVVAHDAKPRRMADIAARAARAGASIETVTQVSGHFDVVLCDVPCSGSGAWRRQPDAKWRLTEARLGELVGTQAAIIDTALGHLRPGGHLVYMTCSLLRAENEAQVQAALERHPGLAVLKSRRFTPLDGGDGFFVAVCSHR